jgi:hypothetical protein
MPNIHLQVRKARDQLENMVIDWASNSGLTSIEMIRAVHSIQDWFIRTALREERHPDNPDKKADEE